MSPTKKETIPLHLYMSWMIIALVDFCFSYVYSGKTLKESIVHSFIWIVAFVVMIPFRASAQRERKIAQERRIEFQDGRR